MKIGLPCCLCSAFAASQLLGYVGRAVERGVRIHRSDYKSPERIDILMVTDDGQVRFRLCQSPLHGAGCRLGPSSGHHVVHV
jgi:hypothetical protein